MVQEGFKTFNQKTYDLGQFRDTKKTPSTEPSNWNEFTEFLCRVLEKRDSTLVMRKAACKMLAAIINKNDNIDGRVWEAIEKASRDQVTWNMDEIW